MCRAAAWLAGRLASRVHGFGKLFGAFVLACLVIHLFGWAQLSTLSGPKAALRLGLFPFIGVDLLKALIAAGLVRAIRSRQDA